MFRSGERPCAGLQSGNGPSGAGHQLTLAVQGGVAGGWAFFDLLHKRIAPMALDFGKLNPVMVQGAVLARITITEGWSEYALDLIKTGDVVRVDPQAKKITVLSD